MVRSLLKKYNIKGGTFDQHFLVDTDYLDRIVAAADLRPEDVVLEIGAGIGNLTERLARKAKKVIVIELDPALVRILHDRFDGVENIEIIAGDALKVDFPEFDKVVSNLPYSISSEITFKLLRHKFKLGILMYQYEFAARMVSQPNCKDYSRLTVDTCYFADASILMKVPKSAFQPAPEVDSAVVKLVPRPAPFEVKDQAFFMDFVAAVFSQRRKKLRNAILNTNHVLKIPSVKEVVARLPEDLMNKRAENLTPEELAQVANKIVDLKKSILAEETKEQ
ncbi:MAG TPA: 16S rRNA (adenine(1518)-N(6)/adenine(1519)-N(6))-dimethyltransferase RsmA [Methanosarcina thermophila]|uniref:16S rRNA (adenine(1518)-N(6)/adenine(1519)-N(6))- dimethyltransferase RsmA n=1 Tax=Methanosarcina thermophila TaxID=2210 RepID=UPI0015F2B474|nr:16S rRNA (adenine(1518)-N(6)/adenine(1519)-N(6))-dimethyltransferase RsmA [Methanosarcina thermophila]HOA69414.1 16S rRNA (adenine(1518)-N(6)/adenine(1519)-N(6))-dimethyltransferase RsmA [Methanosarcina thermophila]HOQ65562.1 16S rRNA (adenine(1518)-N(6)/adenine(1519)-N(6))-dimethyltransferase RsmA [Methanosarcina thermophila]HPT81149.1 16S rRNA (adenine(1518)-N(6)/adenine(1519)-N(6))-dimethyltransferase RsmA [Methanosarcina thermophila]HPZ20570.1 16S rRNA (adenine(1518)-N(6)/adenine(1519)-N